MTGAYLYILRCADQSYYVGTSRKDLDARVAEHNSGQYNGYTAGRRPVELAFAQHFEVIADAIAAERQVKGWSRAKKQALIAGDWSKLSGLARRGGPSSFETPAGGGLLRMRFDMVPTRRFIIAGLSATLAAPYVARAQAGAVTLIVPFAAGGSTDAIARIIAEAMRAPLGQNVLVENHGGAGGSLGTAQIARAAPDGLTIGMGTASTLAINPAAYVKLPYDVRTDLTPIGAIADVPNIMEINPAVPAPDMAAFIALAKARPDGFSYGSSGNGSVSHLMGEQFKLATGTRMVHVPYRGVGPALADTVGGQIQVMFDNLPTSLPLVQAGKLRALAVSSPQRLKVLPDVPTFAELKLGELNWSAFFGLVAPAHTPQPVVARLNAALNDALAQASVRDLLSAQQAAVTPGTPAEFSALIGREVARMQRATQAANIRIE